MAEKFDEFSKHLAKKPTRRGLFKIFGAGIIGAFTATALPRGDAQADPGILHTFFLKLLSFNATNPNFNSTLPFLLIPPPAFNSTQPPVYFNKTFLWFFHRNH